MREKTDFAQIFVQIAPEATQTDKQTVMLDLQNKFADFADAKVEVKDFEQGPPLEAPVAIRIFGDNLDTLRSLSMQVEDIIKKIPGSIYVDNPLGTRQTDLKIKK